MARSRGLPPGSYGHLEANSHFATRFGREEDFEGGLCYVMIVRYSDTPVGPYDELIWMPGSFSVGAHVDGPPKKAWHRVTRIYVSQFETVKRGRENWNIPKTV
ncbi:hypothetical protein BJX66DRAFT_345843 [Aspergillus keveii]|uniref:Uncharacterized protein n=1 Tax=Aspergillus keveii TaxID=714993 RepID=A0ABR4FGQ0_9EURO